MVVINEGKKEGLGRRGRSEKYYQATSITSDSMLIPWHGHSIISVVSTTNPLTAADAMVDDYICHCPQIPSMHCLQQISQLPFTTICCVQRIKISWKISWTQQINTHIPIEKLHKKCEQNYCWFAATSAITVGPPPSICGLLKIFLFVQETKIKSVSTSPYADDDRDLLSKA